MHDGFKSLFFLFDNLIEKQLSVFSTIKVPKAIIFYNDNNDSNDDDRRLSNSTV